MKSINDLHGPDPVYLADNFRKLREAWFSYKLFSRAQERVCEPEEQKAARVERNKMLKKKYDEDTEAIISGEQRSIAPTCPNDMSTNTGGRHEAPHPAP